MARAKSPDEVVKKWSRNLQNSKESIKAGVQAVQVSPTAKAAMKADKYVAGVERAVESGKYQKALQEVTLGDWQQAMIGKGLDRIAQGVKSAEPAYAQFMSQWLPFVEGVSAAIDQMPNDTEDQRDQRMLENVRRLRQFRGRK